MRHFIAIGPSAGWGKGHTEAEAVQEMRKAFVDGEGEEYRYETFEVHPKTTVNDVGKMQFPKGHPPISLGVTNPKVKAKEVGVPSLDFRGPAKQKSKPKVRITEAEHTRILNLAAEMRKRGPVAPVLTATEVKLGRAVDALKKIREMGYSSEASRATDTVLACIRVAEAAIRTVEGMSKEK